MTTANPLFHAAREMLIGQIMAMSGKRNANARWLLESQTNEQLQSLWQEMLETLIHDNPGLKNPRS
jgi:hypothetical protein